MTPFDMLLLAMLGFVVLVLAFELVYSRLKRPTAEKRRWTQYPRDGNPPPDDRR